LRNDFVKSVLITFSGIDGAGKSTQLEKLLAHLRAQGIPVRQLVFWDNVAVFRQARSGFSRRVLQSDGRVGTPERPAMRQDKNLQNWRLFLGRSFLHLLDIISLRRVLRNEDGRAAIIVFDRYIYDQLAALPLERWWARSFARLLLHLAPRPQISYVLDAVPEQARARKPEYPVEFMHKYRSSYLELCALFHLDLIPAAEMEEVHAAIIERFNRCMAAHSLEAVASPVIA
jgi:thymidylate kinase